MAKKIVLTGGGTSGHVAPNIALMPELRKAGYEINYIGSKEGIEKNLIEDLNVPYYGISCGKLRRYKSLKNLTDPFRIIKGFFEARKALKEIKPDIIFSKGGYVAVPVVHAAFTLRIPCINHESDITPGLANKLCIPFCKKICCNFPETMQYVSKNKGVLTGTPIREELSEGKRKAGLELCGFSDSKPVMLIIGGSQGSRRINEVVRESLPVLLKDFQIIHLCGKGNFDSSLESTLGYKQFEYLKDDLKDAFAACDIVISRAGANAICELLSLHKPNLLIPLPTKGSRGDQLLNAASFAAQGFSMVLKEEELTKESLTNAIRELYCNRQTYLEAMNRSGQMNPILTIVGLLEKYRKTEKKKEA